MHSMQPRIFRIAVAAFSCPALPHLPCVNILWLNPLQGRRRLSRSFPESAVGSYLVVGLCCN